MNKFSNPAARQGAAPKFGCFYKFMFGSISLVHVLSVIAFWFPGSGYRNRESAGALTNVGVNGYFWSSSPFENGATNAGNMNFNNSNGLNPVNNNNRANGFSVRCVSELIQ